MERKIGEIFEYNGEWYQTVEAPIDEHSCNGCQGCKGTGGPRIFGGECNGNARKDNKFVIFKKLEKVGEPYFNGQYGEVLQEYKYYIPPITPDLRIHIIKLGIVGIEIKQNKEDMEEKNEVKGANVLSKEEWCIIEKAQEDWKRIFPDIPLMSSMSVDAFFPHIIKLGLLDKYKEHSNSEKIGKNLKPFDLQKAKDGKPVCTRDGRKARIIYFDAKGDKPIIALIEMGVAETPNNYPIDGKAISTKETPCDLMMLPEKKERWVNVYRNKKGEYWSEQVLFSTKKEAIDFVHDHAQYVTTVKIEWEE